MTTALGIGGSIHDFASCLIHDGRVIAIEDERISRVRYSVGEKSPCQASSDRCLAAMGLRRDDVDQIVGNDELLHTIRRDAFPGAVYLNHHFTHAASGFFTSRFHSSAILVVDGAGSLVEGQLASEGEVRETTTFAHGEGNDIRMLDSIVGSLHGSNPLSGRTTVTSNSLGEFYRVVAEALDLGWLTGPGKMMGLASYGSARRDDRFVEELMRTVRLLPRGRFEIDTNGRTGLIDRLFLLRQGAGADPDFEWRSALAYAGQVVLETVMDHALDFLRQEVPSPNLCLVGGVALNAIANGRILGRNGYENVHVFFAPNDSGTAIGAALWATMQNSGNAPEPYRATLSPFLGPAYESHGSVRRLETSGARVVRCPDIHVEVARLIADGRIVAWYQGGSEFGPRALGNRSLLADPRRATMRERLNLDVKRREWFRPFAVATLSDHAEELFEIGCSSPWMQFVWPVRDHVREVLPAITHVDGGTRVQTVTPADNAGLHRVLECFHARTGVPALLNTSFNVRQPMVETPAEAVETFLSAPIDALVLGDVLVTKEAAHG